MTGEELIQLYNKENVRYEYTVVYSTYWPRTTYWSLEGAEIGRAQEAKRNPKSNGTIYKRTVTVSEWVQ